MVRLMQTAVGRRTAVAFTTPEQLASVLGPEQLAVRLSLSALRAMLTPLGLAEVVVDPQLTARPVADGSSAAAPDLIRSKVERP
ncbi:hypothetical protein GCM10027456_63690 [Kineosporia babensis]